MDFKQTIEKHYAVKIKSIELIDSHFGTEIHIANTGDCRYIIKTLPLYMESARKEGYITDFLSNNGIKVARFLKTNNGEFSVTTKECILTIQEFIEGETFKVNSAPDWVIDKSAEILGKINSVLKNYGELPLCFGTDFFTSETAIQKKCDYEKELLNANEKGDDNSASLWEEQIKHLAKISEFCIDTSKLTYANSHGDFHIGQVIVNGDDITIIDWASACRLPICLEVITSFVFASPECKDGSINVNELRTHINHYCKHFSLSPYDIKMMPYVLYFWHCICNYSPVEKIPNSYKPIATLILNLLNWLHDNVEELSESLYTE